MQDSASCERLPEVSFHDNRELKYLREHLGKVKTPSTKAGVYLRYLAGCDFNANLAPHSTIEFYEEDVEELVAVEENSDNEIQVRYQRDLTKSLQSAF